MKLGERISIAAILFFGGMLAGILWEQWGIVRNPHFFCGPLTAGHTITCPEEK